MKFLDRLPWVPLLIMALLLGLAPYPMQAQPHLLEKLGMLMDGTLTRPIDIFDLLLHASLPVLAALKLIRVFSAPNKPS